MPRRPDYRSVPRRFSGSEATRPQIMRVIAAIWIAALLVAAAAASVIFFDRTAVQEALRHGLAADNPSRSVHAIDDAVRYTLFGLLAGAVVLAIANAVCLASVWSGSRRARSVQVLVSLATVAALAGAWGALSDAHRTADHLPEWGPIATAALVVVGAVLLFMPAVNRWFGPGRRHRDDRHPSTR